MARQALEVGRRRDLLGGFGRDDRFRLAGRGGFGLGGNQPLEKLRRPADLGDEQDAAADITAAGLSGKP
ncbi:MAG TPA: hypothetical protein VFS35_10480, partial [Terrimicrobiaceae bacterium]|nr:hypothetical protein [Terrimicrobiaceae bacterium]